MSTNQAESILRKHTEASDVLVGEMYDFNVDLIICDDLSTARAIEFFRKMKGTQPVNSNRILVTCEHFAPPTTLDGAEIQNLIRKKIREWKIDGFHELGRSGIGPVVAVSNSLVKPGMLIVGTDPITGALGGLGCLAVAVGAGDIAALWRTGKIHLMLHETLEVVLEGKKQANIDIVDIALTAIKQLDGVQETKIIELSGKAAQNLNIDDRLELSYFLVESGATSAIIPSSNELLSMLKLPLDDNLTKESATPTLMDYSIQMDAVKPMISLPSGEIISIDEIEETKIDLVIIGGGLGGTIQNLIELDRIIAHNKLHPDVRMVVYPASNDIFVNAAKTGIIERLATAGAVVCAPGRGPEGYGHHGICTKGESVLINSSLNNEGLYGHMQASIHLAGTKVCATSALAGRIVSQTEGL